MKEGKKENEREKPKQEFGKKKRCKPTRRKGNKKERIK